MEQKITFSGIIFVLFAVLLGLSSGLECIKCKWSVEDTNSTDTCLGEPYKENLQTCQKSPDNAVLVCITMATFKAVGKSQYLQTLTRECGKKHLKCNNECKPPENDGLYRCNMCCNENDRCNSFPLKSKLLTQDMFYNVTNLTNGSLNIYYYSSKTLTFILILCFLCLI